MNEKSRCSFLFLLLVRGGKWQTVTESPVSSANFCTPHFHKRSFEPLLPPESAVMSNLFASGYARFPINFHHCRMLWTANSAVSWSTPTLTQPTLRPMSYTP